MLIGLVMILAIFKGVGTPLLTLRSFMWLCGIHVCLTQLRTNELGVEAKLVSVLDLCSCYMLLLLTLFLACV